MLGRLFLLGMVGMVSAVELTGVVHFVTVGKGGFKFVPNTTNADPGDIVSFQFYPTNHSVVRMDPSVPCKPYELVNTSDADGGWWSGFKVVSAFLNPPPSWNITINDTSPLWYYCSAPDSCVNYEMVGGINVDNTTYNTVALAASNAGYSLSPGESWRGDATTATSSPTSTSSSSSSSSSTSSGVVLSAGAIAGIAIGGIIALALIGLLFFFVGRKKKGAEVKASIAPSTPSPEVGEHPPVYQDPRYSQLPVGTGHWDQKAQQEEQARLAAANPHRVSELPDTNAYDPVEIYTPGPDDMPEHRR